jgi:hypothetical protein
MGVIKYACRFISATTPSFHKYNTYRLYSTGKLSVIQFKGLINALRSHKYLSDNKKEVHKESLNTAIKAYLIEG